MLTTLVFSLAMTQSALPPLTVRGADLIDPNGKKVLLKGCNVGNWLMLEPWMLALDTFKDQYDLEETLSKRFGPSEKERLMDLYRTHWMGQNDFDRIRSFGMNVVRLPLNYRIFEDDAAPFQLRPNAWMWIDRAIEMAERSGLYTILDMHGVQGGQSVYDHTGRVGQNKLWGDPQNQGRLAWLWGEVAKRYRNRSAVVAYDVFNEPYGGTHQGQKEVFARALAEIRKHDPEKLVYAHGHYDGFAHYGIPKHNGWHNVGLQMHYYPGLFGGGDPTLTTHARHLKNLELVAEQMREFGVPFLVGEMNVVFREAGGAGMMRRTFDLHASYGWATTMWSYKVLSKEGGIGAGTWGMVTSAKAARQIDFSKASKEEIESYFRSLSTDPVVVYEELRTALTTKAPELPELPPIPDPIRSAPDVDRISGWRVADIGGARKGGLVKRANRLELFGGGSDIWASSDQFRFLYREVSGDFDVSVRVDGITDTHSYAKAGLMARASLAAAAPAVLISTFPGGGIETAQRSSAGGEMSGGKSGSATFPMRLRMARKGKEIRLYWGQGEEAWQLLQTFSAPSEKLLVGLVALSHDDRQLAKVEYADLVLSR